MSRPEWNVMDVTARNDYTLLLTFQDGQKKVYDASFLLDKPIYSRLRSLPFFLSARVECGTVVWSDECDIAPEHLYECSVPIEETDMTEIRIPKFMEGGELPPGYFDSPDPYSNPPSSRYNMRAMVNWALRNGKKVTDLTKVEAGRFLVPDTANPDS
jgi:hypothetical protein